MGESVVIETLAGFSVGLRPFEAMVGSMTARGL